MPPARSPPTASRSICRQRARADSCPISKHSTTRCSRARSPATSRRRRTRRARSPIAPISTSLRRSRAVSVSSCSQTNAIAKSTASTRRPACWKRPGPISPTSSCSIRCPSARTFPVCASASPPATGASSLPIWNCATSRRRKCRRRRSTSRLPPTATKRMCRKTASFIPPNSISPTRSSATATATSGRPADFFFGSTSRSKAAARSSPRQLWAEAGVRVVPGTVPRARAGRRQQSRRGLYPRRHGAGQGSHGGGAASPRRGARLGM